MLIQDHDKYSITISVTDSDFSYHFAVFQSSFASLAGLSKIRFRVYPGKDVIDIAAELRKTGRAVQTGDAGTINTYGEAVHEYCELAIDLNT